MTSSLLAIARGFRFGGRVRTDMSAIALCVPLISLHRTDRLCWSWLLNWERHREASGVTHGWLRVIRIPGFQSRTIVDVLRLGSFHFVRQDSKQ